ncbi:helix-turn-helix transcriptional regulator [Clostridium botulinum]|nr:helix-turn-helix transcriptional regulator [Clostridium botulinum]NFI05184.1 helix-turn-helix transcriptional regulator [Clostridium botulinum]NFP41181.1 helix-turn-helix transcriptional regulator [Clostridium botulinum]
MFSFILSLFVIIFCLWSLYMILCDKEILVKMKADILKKLRNENNITQQQLAKELGVSRSLIGMIESSQQDGGRELTKKVAQYFNVSMDYLEGLTEKTATVERETLVSNFLEFLVESGVITDSNNIDQKTHDMILNMVKTEIEILKKGKK